MGLPRQLPIIFQYGWQALTLLIMLRFSNYIVYFLYMQAANQIMIYRSGASPAEASPWCHPTPNLLPIA